MFAKQLSFSVNLGDDPCSTLLRANLKELLINTLVEKFSMSDKLAGIACVRLFGSTLIRAATSSFPFADRKSEDLDLEIYISPKASWVDAAALFKKSLYKIKELAIEAGIKVETYNEVSVEQAIESACRGDRLETLRLQLSYSFPEELLPVLCGRYAHSNHTTKAILEVNITPPKQITILTPPEMTLDGTQLSNTFFRYDTIVHYLAKVITRSAEATKHLIPEPSDPSTFRPTDVMNIFNICFATHPRLVPFRITPRALQNTRNQIETDDALLKLRLLVLCNFAVFGKSSAVFESIDVSKFDPSQPDVINDFRNALKPTLGRGDVLESKKLAAILNGFRRLLQELFPAPKELAENVASSKLYLYPEERLFLDDARGSIQNGVNVNLTSLAPLFEGRYQKLINALSPYLTEALDASPSIRDRDARFFELSQFSC